MASCGMPCRCRFIVVAHLKVLALVGNTIDTSDDICGAAFSKKNDHKIAIWTKHSQQDVTLNIGYVYIRHYDCFLAHY
jgi:hypothetical protein